MADEKSASDDFRIRRFAQTLLPGLPRPGHSDCFSIMAINLTEHLRAAPKAKPAVQPANARRKKGERRMAFDGFFYFCLALVLLTLALQFFLIIWMDLF